MAESCGGNWWNLPENLFGRTVCSMGTNDVLSFDWPSHADNMIITDIKGARSSDDSSAGFSSSATPDDWNQEYFFNFSGRSEDDYSNMILPEIAPPTEQYPSNPISTSGGIFPLDSATSSLLQTLFDTDDESDQPLHGFLPTFPAISPMVHLPFGENNHFPFSNSVLPSTTQSQISLPSSPSSTNRNLQGVDHAKKRNEEARRVGPEKSGNEPALKRARIQTPSPLPTFKVRKEKLGDRVTALQQLVSPFGKTDTASVLQEAIEYIRFLHDQVSVLSSPYLKRVGGSPALQNGRVQAADRVTGQEGQMQDLRGRGLCLVPISSTFPVTFETTADFWTPIFNEGSFK